MAPLKRKRAPEDNTAIPDAPPPQRRATRQTSIAPLPVLPDPEPRLRRRGRPAAPAAANTNGHVSPAETRPSRARPRGKENIPMQVEQTAEPQQPLPKLTRLTRHRGLPAHGDDAPSRSIPPAHNTNSVNGNSRLIVPGSSAPSAILPPNNPARPMAKAAGPMGTAGFGTSRKHGRSEPEPLVQSRTVGHTKPITMATSTTKPAPTPLPVASNAAPGQTERSSGQQPERNIDKVVLGDICFKAWYASYYGKEVLGDAPHGSKADRGAQVGSFTSNGTAASVEDGAGGKAHPRRERDSQPVLDRLYVCPCCFKYSKELVAWWEHVQMCERQGFMPGSKIYVHPKGRRTVLVPSAQAPKPMRGKRGSVGPKVVERVVQDEGEWSIWEVDGAKDVLFCQNLSLFAKLFLDNKSVFFDVTGFNYFLLVYTPPAPPTDPDAEIAEVVEPRGHIVGFFSKEKMSWDNNNLACILIFPPWQRKGLGALLMGISYEISRREGVIGGPEKPISDLGKKGYKRFWAGEVARWILSQDVKSASDPAIVDVRECSQATWIAPEDCLLVLREMGVAEDAGKGHARVGKLKGEENGTSATEADEMVQRVTISQDAIRKWVAAHGISLEKTCDPDGFVEGYAIPPPAEEEEAG